MNETPKPRRLRWFQYSLRTLLFVMLLASIGMSWVAVRIRNARKQKAAVEAIEKLGGEVTYDWTFDKSQSGPPGPAWMRGLLGADFFGKVVIVSLDFTQVTDTGLEPLEGLSQLKGLFLSGTHVTDAGLKHISKLNQLQTLSLIGTQVTDVGFGTTRGIEPTPKDVAQCHSSDRRWLGTPQGVEPTPHIGARQYPGDRRRHQETPAGVAKLRDQPLK